MSNMIVKKHGEDDHCEEKIQGATRETLRRNSCTAP